MSCGACKLSSGPAPDVRNLSFPPLRAHSLSCHFTPRQSAVVTSPLARERRRLSSIGLRKRSRSRAGHVTESPVCKRSSVSDLFRPGNMLPPFRHRRSDKARTRSNFQAGNVQVSCLDGVWMLIVAAKKDSTRWVPLCIAGPPASGSNCHSSDADLSSGRVTGKRPYASRSKRGTGAKRILHILHIGDLSAAHFCVHGKGGCKRLVKA